MWGKCYKRHKIQRPKAVSEITIAFYNKNSQHVDLQKQIIEHRIVEYRL